MAFCTECGSKLPDDAVFCPNCGASMTASGKNDSSAFEEVKAVEYSAPVSVTFQNEAASDTTSFQTSGVFNEPPQGNVSIPSQGTYAPPVQNNYIPPFQGGYAPQPQTPYNPQNAYGYQPQGGGVGVNTMPPKKKLSGGMIALIVIGSVILLAFAIYFAGYLYGQSQARAILGYWESVSVDTGDGITDDYYGTSIVGALCVQINSDSSVYLASSTNEEIVDGTWKENDKGITITTSDDTYDFLLKNKQLILQKDGETFYFEKADGDINNPTIPRGYDSEDGSELSSGIAGSGYVDNGDSYISVIGAEDITDVDGDDAIRVYYEYTNNYEGDYSSSAYNALGYDVSQDGNQLQETYAAYESSVVNNASYYIRQGLTIQCFVEFKYNRNGGSVDINIYGYSEGEGGGMVTATYTPGSLPGAPAPYVITPVSDPQWTMNLPAEGELDSFYVAVNDAELITDANGDQAIRVYYEFTNNSDHNTSIGDELYLFTYQDGISLDYTNAAQDSETDMNYYTEIAPGSKITVTCIFVLRNQTSPVEAEVEAYSAYAAVGQTYDIAS